MSNLKEFRRKHTEESKKKMSDSHIGKQPWNKGKKGVQIAWNKGLKGYLAGKKITWKDKISIGKKNSLKSKVASQKAANNARTFIKNSHWHTEEWKKKLSERWKGSNNPNWNGDFISSYSSDWSEDLRESIRKRDGYICQMEGCGIHQDELNGFQKKHDVHHIDYDKQNLNPENLITLCKFCHRKTNFNREEWIKYFNGE